MIATSAPRWRCQVINQCWILIEQRSVLRTSALTPNIQPKKAYDRCLVSWTRSGIPSTHLRHYGPGYDFSLLRDEGRGLASFTLLYRQPCRGMKFTSKYRPPKQISPNVPSQHLPSMIQRGLSVLGGPTVASTDFGLYVPWCHFS